MIVNISAWLVCLQIVKHNYTTVIIVEFHSTYIPTLNIPTLLNSIFNSVLLFLEHQYYPKCECHIDRRRMICEEDGYEDPPYYRVITQDILQVHYLIIQIH